MSSVTGIELGPDYCMLVRTERRSGRTAVVAAQAVTSAEWSDDPDTLVDVLRRARRRNRLANRARVVAWVPQASHDLARREELAPFVAAGFEIESVLSPAQALARVVRTTQPDVNGSAVAALSLNAHGASITIVSGESILYSRSFEWPLGRPFCGARSELFDRYLVISQLAPQVQHAIELVRPLYGVKVGSAVACGNLPNLRSLVMLLIEEIDLEVETLDSAELLAGRLGASADALHLASAAASFEDTALRPWTAAAPQKEVGTFPGKVPTSFVGTALGGTTFAGTASIGGKVPASLVAGVAAGVLCAMWSTMQVSGSSPATPIFPSGIESTLPIPAVPELRIEATMGRIEPRVESTAIAGVPIDSSSTARTPRETESQPPDSQSPPLPQVAGILIAGSRRLAIVDGNVVAAGDRVGERTITRIGRDGVVLRERSGQEVYVAIRPKKPDIPPS
jgi:hypothetical protein